ncbi:MAG TPA: hypothetical protein P5211_08425, partial [Anaerolineae bacterium]|nr:hypothetical protein [Anaerolineae bacterium]
FSVSGATFVTQVIFLAFSLFRFLAFSLFRFLAFSLFRFFAFSPFRFFADSLIADSLISIFEGGNLDASTIGNSPRGLRRLPQRSDRHARSGLQQ